jgi:hypothetical protein
VVSHDEHPSVRADLCLICHGSTSPNGPHTGTVEEHTHHARGSAGSDCVACHMPKVAQTVANVNVCSHTFEIIGPKMTDEFNSPNSCNGCHADADRVGASCDADLAKRVAVARGVAVTRSTIRAFSTTRRWSFSLVIVIRVAPC